MLLQETIIVHVVPGVIDECTFHCACTHSAHASTHTHTRICMQTQSSTQSTRPRTSKWIAKNITKYRRLLDRFRYFTSSHVRCLRERRITCLYCTHRSLQCMLERKKFLKIFRHGREPQFLLIVIPILE